MVMNQIANQLQDY